jgi:hypothetical protein
MFQYSNCHIVSFLYCIKNELEILYFFTNTYDLHCILLYVSFDFFISQLYCLLAIKKHVNNTHTLIHLH